MGSMSIWHWLVVGVIVLILFGGRGKISELMGDVARGIKSFRKGLADDEKPLPGILKEIATRLEQMHPEMRVSILIREPGDGRLYTGAAPSLPAFFNAAVSSW